MKNKPRIPRRLVGALAVVLVTASACSSESHEKAPDLVPRTSGTLYTVHDTLVQATFAAAGIAAPVQQAILSTKLMGTVTQVLVKEGDLVSAGQLLVRIDARDLGAKSAQAAASVSDADAMHREAVTQTNRIRALYADSAATRAQLDAAQTGLARAEAGVRVARAASAEIGAVSSYAAVRAPFGGIITRRFVDPGAFAAPGAPLVAIQDASQLRITANATPNVAQAIHRGQPLDATIEGKPFRAIVEGVVPSTAGNLYTINALLPNPGRIILAGSTATLALRTGERSTLVVPANAVTREGDLTGVMVRTAQGDELRWVRLGAAAGGMVEVTAGLRSGELVVVRSGAVSMTGSN